ncbi:MAG: amidophosphoribosyltransferase [Alphaproteobacteria bacterium]|nr:amidophosphoribosyltransferase [Alphaproteobacteria bacterium]
MPPAAPSIKTPALNTPALECYRGLLVLQHRGQDAAGIVSYDNATHMFAAEKDHGLVAQIFDQQRIDRLAGYMAIGHTRYATIGTDGANDIQPMMTGIPFGLAMAHNGNILNYFPLAQKLNKDFRRQLLTHNDLEVLIHYFAHYLTEKSGGIPDQSTFTFDNIKNAAGKVFDTMVGGYAVVSLIANEGLVAFRDPKGLRPLVIGARGNGDGSKTYCFASETIALTYLGYDYVRDVAPGEAVFVSKDGTLQSAVVREEEKPSPCMFEWVYFSGAEGAQGGKSVYAARLSLGIRLGLRAREAIMRGEIAPDVVMPVPDTSRPAAISVADALKLPYREGLIKNRYVQRSFILGTQEKREQAVELKLSPVRSEIEGKNIFLVDDSIVRGTTARKIVAMLKKYGAKSITLGITCPPHRHGCYYGIDFPDASKLLANGKSAEEIASWLGADKVIYLDNDDLRQAIGVHDMCMACLDGQYPTETEESAAFSAQRHTAGGKT